MRRFPRSARRAGRLGCVVLTCVVIGLPGAPAPAAVAERTLDNGLTLVVKQDTGSDIAAVEVMVRVGQAREGKDKAGLRAVLQEVILRRMQERLAKDAKWAALAEQRDAGDRRRLFNAATDWDYVESYGTVTSDRLGDCCRFLAAGVFDPEITQETFDEAIASVSGLVAQSPGGPRLQAPPGLREAHGLLRKAMSSGRDLGLPLYGTSESIGNLSLDDLKGFHRKYYVPQNVCVAVVSPLPADEAARLIEGAFGQQKRSGSAVAPPKPTEKLARDVEVAGSADLRTAFVRGEDVACLMIGVHMPTVPEKEACAADVIHAALARPNGRLDRDLALKKSLPEVYYLGPVPRGDPPMPLPAFSTTPTPGADRLDSIRALLSRTDTVGAYMAVQAWVDPFTLNDAKAKIISHLQAFADKPLKDEELQAAKAFAVNVYARAHETKRDAAWLLARREMLGQSPADDETYAETVQALTAEDIQQVAQKCLTQPSIAVVLPLSE